METKLSKLQRWILTRCEPREIWLREGNKGRGIGPDRVRILSDYLGLPVRARHRVFDHYLVVDRQTIDRKLYAKPAVSMNRALRRLKGRGLITDGRKAYWASGNEQTYIVLTPEGEKVVKALGGPRPLATATEEMIKKLLYGNGYNSRILDL